MLAPFAGCQNSKERFNYLQEAFNLKDRREQLRLARRTFANFPDINDENLEESLVKMFPFPGHRAFAAKFLFAKKSGWNENDAILLVFLTWSFYQPSTGWILEMLEESENQTVTELCDSLHRLIELIKPDYVETMLHPKLGAHLRSFWDWSDDRNENSNVLRYIMPIASEISSSIALFINEMETVPEESVESVVKLRCNLKSTVDALVEWLTSKYTGAQTDDTCTDLLVRNTRYDIGQIDQKLLSSDFGRTLLLELQSAP